MSDSSSSSSPNSSFEQGELKSSPEQYKKRERALVISKGDQQRKVTLASPHIHEVLEVDDKDNADVIEIPSDDGEVERDALNIKPPQSQAGPVRREKTHKRKHKAERRREKQNLKQAREVEREKERRRQIVEHHPRVERIEVKDRGIRGFKDAREIVRERQKEKVKRQKEVARDDWAARDDRDIGKEARKRKESLKERERLENMEREKQRERRLREEREKADKQRRKEEERRLQQRAEDTRPRDKGARNIRLVERSNDRSIDRPMKERGRIKEQRRQRNDRDRSDIRERVRPRKEDNERGRPRGPRSQEQSSHSEHREEEKKPPTPVQLVKEEEEDEEEVEEEEEEVVVEPPSPRANILSEDEDHMDKTPVHEKTSSSEEESDSDHKSSSSGSMDEEHKRPVKSKFENESDNEEVEKSGERSHSLSSPSEVEEEGDYVQDTPPESPISPKEDLPLYLPAVQGCRNVEEFHCMNRIEEGTYGVVYRAKDRKTGEIVALKRLKMEKEKEGFPITSLREINTLLKAQHTNIVTVREIVVGSNMDKIYIVMDYVEHDLKSLMETMKHPFSVGEVKTLMIQLLRAVAHLHDNWILHRDLKTSNLLLSHKGILKVGDFGLAREYGSPLKAYTPVVVTLWYRAPELLLCVKEYSKPIDMWSVGCIHAEFLTMKALWPGKSDIDQLNKIFKDLGTPNEKIWEGISELPGFKKASFQQHPQNTIRNRFGPQFSDLGFDLLNRLLTYDPKKRIDAKTALEHKWFVESPLPTDPGMFPTWPARSEQPGRRHNSPKPPSGGKAFAKLMAEDVNLPVSGFHMDTAAKGASAQGAGFQLKF